jgi:hypothetical protein
VQRGGELAKLGASSKRAMGNRDSARPLGRLLVYSSTSFWKFVGYTLENVGNSHVYFVKGRETALLPSVLASRYALRCVWMVKGLGKE